MKWFISSVSFTWLCVSSLNKKCHLSEYESIWKPLVIHSLQTFKDVWQFISLDSQCFILQWLFSASFHSGWIMQGSFEKTSSGECSLLSSNCSVECRVHWTGDSEQFAMQSTCNTLVCYRELLHHNILCFNYSQTPLKQTINKEHCLKLISIIWQYLF